MRQESKLVCEIFSDRLDLGKLGSFYMTGADWRHLLPDTMRLRWLPIRHLIQRNCRSIPSCCCASRKLPNSCGQHSSSDTCPSTCFTGCRRRFRLGSICAVQLNTKTRVAHSKC